MENTAKYHNMPLMKLIIFTVVPALLIACSSTPEDLRQSKPIVEATSKKPAKDVAICVAEKWESMSPLLQVILRPTKTGYQITGHDKYHGSMGDMVDVDESQSVTSIKYYSINRTEFSSRMGRESQACR